MFPHDHNHKYNNDFWEGYWMKGLGFRLLGSVFKWVFKYQTCGCLPAWARGSCIGSVNAGEGGVSSHILTAIKHAAMSGSNKPPERRQHSGGELVFFLISRWTFLGVSHLCCLQNLDCVTCAVYVGLSCPVGQ